jgi:CRISPR-associated protein Cmr6
MPNYPLPYDTVQVFRQVQRFCHNPGLLFDRYTGYGRDWSLDSDPRTRTNPKHEALKAVRDTPMDAKLHRAFVARWQAALVAQGADTFETQPEWRFVVGLGRKGPLEVGMTFHRIYGFPIIPGSSLKGLAQAYAELVESASEEKRKHVFGDAPGPGGDPSMAHVGQAVFFDAVPLLPPHLEIDVMNPHYADYYQGNAPPADYLSPTPIYFLTVGQGSRYLFAVAGTEKAQARKWLEGGLRELGSGAKTSAGYGYWGEILEERVRPDTIPPTPPIIEPQVPPGYQRGRVKVFGLGESRSYGFIYSQTGGTEIFVHRSGLAEGVTTLEEGQEVIFKVVQTPKGKQAEDVRPVGSRG